MKRNHLTPELLVMAVICGLIPFRATGDIWNEAEHGDAGELISTAQPVTESGFLTEINGEINGGGDRDIFQIYINDPANFSFHVTATGQATNNADTLLALFDASGFGIIYNDDISDSDFTSLLSSTNGLLTQPGTYHLAIMGSGQEFTSASGNIWLEQAPWTDTKAPDGPGATDNLIGYSSSLGTNIGTYTITISDSVTGVPEPSSCAIALVAVCLAMAASRRRVSRNVLQS